MGFRKNTKAYEKVANDEAGSLNIVQGILLKSTDFLWRIFAPSGGQGGVTMSSLCPNCNSFPWRTTCGGFQLERSIAVGGAQSVERYESRVPNGLLVVHTGDSASQAKVFKAHAVPQGVCEKPVTSSFACGSLTGKNLQMKVVEDFESRLHKAVSFVDEREKGATGME